jgi:small subunit ribosomal protein S3
VLCRTHRSTAQKEFDYGFREAATSAGRIGVKVWLYKGEILPYKSPNDDRIAREAAMAVGQTSGHSDATLKVVTSAGPRVADVAETEIVPLVKEADPEFERLLAEEEDIQRRIVDSHETPKFGRE